MTSEQDRLKASRVRGEAATIAPGTSTPVIELEKVYKSFGSEHVLRGVDLKVEAGTTFVLLGTSGSGKTVLMKHLIGLVRPDRGHVRIDGEDLNALPGRQLDRVRKKMGILFQSGALFDSLTVFDNVAFPLREDRQLSTEQIRKTVLEKLASVGLSKAVDRYPAQLSGGMQKRVAFARAIVLDPKILLYDEPLAGLDPMMSRSLSEIILTGKSLGATSLAIIADIPNAFRVADRMGLLHQGQLVEHGSPDMFRQSQHPAVVAFLRTWKQGQR